MRDLIFIQTEITSGAEAFGIEDAILADERFADVCVAFTWRTPPTVMLGRFQNALAECRTDLIEERGIELVRRSTGGGTIYTDAGTFQFSLVCPRSDDSGKRQAAVDFGRFLRPVRQILSEIGIPCEMSSRNDLLCSGRKFNGNAQHIEKERVLHHGSILFDCQMDTLADVLTPPPLKLKSKGISSARQRVLNLVEIDPHGRDTVAFQADFDDAFIRLSNPELYTTLSQQDAIVLSPAQSNDSSQSTKHPLAHFSPELLERAQKITQDKYLYDEWTLGKTPAFTLENELLTAGGYLKLYLDIHKLKIRDIKLEGDFFLGEEGLPQILAKLRGEPYQKEDLSPLLKEISEKLAIHQVTFEDLLELFFPR